MTPEIFCRENPGLFHLSADDAESLDRYLRETGVLTDGERVVAAGPAGEGNMNRTVRAWTTERSLIVKQSLPWVERYPTIAAPWDRVLSEARFYALTMPHEQAAARMPRLIEIDATARVIVMDDLGEASDFTSLYAGESLALETARQLAAWLSDLHALTFDREQRMSLTNRPMRELNHEHLFRFPLDTENGLDLDAITPGLSDIARSLAGDAAYTARVAVLGEAYLSDGVSLLHGDFFPGSWLRGDDGPAVIDPEFAYFGRPEFDVGVLLGHLHLSGQGEAVLAAVTDGYSSQPGFDWRLAHAFGGVEIMRRLIGVAQLPLRLGLKEKQSLLRLSRDLVMVKSRSSRCA